MTIENVDLNKKTPQDISNLSSQISASTSKSNISINIFENLTKAQLEQIVSEGVNSTNSEVSKFYQNIKSVGYGNFFSSLDKDQDGVLELNELTFVAGDDKNISGTELNNQITGYLSSILSSFTDTIGSLGTGATYGGTGDFSSQKQQIESQYNNNIFSARTNLSQYISNSDGIKQEYKSQYAALTESLNTIDKQIAEKEKQIAEIEKQIIAIDKEIKDLEGQKDNIDPKDTKKIQEINDKITAKKAGKSKLETQKDELKTGDGGKDALRQQKNATQDNMDSILTEIQSINSDIQASIDEQVNAIEGLEDEKTQQLSEIDAQIQAAKIAAAQEAEAEAEPKNEPKPEEQTSTPVLSSNSKGIGSNIVNIAMGYYKQGYNEANGSYHKFTNGRDEAWCADFVSYVAKQAFKANGKEIPQGFGSASVLGLKNWAVKNNCYSNIQNMSLSQKKDFITSSVKAGDVIVWKQNGASHVAFVKEINSDGTIQTVEGNWGDKVASRKVKLTGDYGVENISGFISLG